MKYWPILIFFVVGIMATLAGIIGKLLHWPHHTFLLGGGMALNVLAIALFVFKITREKNSDSVLK